MHEMWVQDLAKLHFHNFTIHNLFTTEFTKIHKLFNTKIITLNYITLCVRRHERNGGDKLIADWAQKIQYLEICAQSEARTQMGS